MRKIIFTSLLVLSAFYSKSQITSSTFLPHLDFATDANDVPMAVAIKDLDGDNKPEIVVVNFYGPGISVYRNTTTSGIMDASSFAAQVDSTVPGNAGMVRLADMDGDLKYDIVVASADQITILRNTSTIGSISFDSPVYLDELSYANDGEITLDDMNNDGKTDIIFLENILNNSVTTAYFSIITNNIQSPGSFTSASFNSRVDYQIGQYIQTVTTGDIDGDGKKDVIAALKDTILISRNIATSTTIDANSFDTPDTLLGINADDIDVYDIDLDGKNDLVISEVQTWLTLVRNNNTSGSIVASKFDGYAKFDLAGPTGTNPQRLTINDFDSDGKPDVAIANSGPSVVSVLRNISSPGSLTISSLGDTVNFVTPQRANGMASADLDGDGRVDMVAVDGVNGIGSLFSIFQNNTGDAYTAVSNSIAITDLNVYPNPSSGLVNIQTANNINKVSIVTVTGKECYTGLYNASNITIDLTNLTKGMYLVEVYTADGSNSVSKLSVE